MYKHHRNANFHLSFFIRQHFWPIIIPSIAILFLTFCPQISQSIQINTNDYNQQAQNPDRTVAKLSPREVQLKSTLPLSIPPSSTPSTVSFDDSIHALYVISLDGKITAIDARANGRQIWTADTGSPLVDASLSKIEISRDSRSVRLIPSLIGGLFEKYEEDGHVEPLPFDADSLLDSTFKLHDELVINGGKHIDTLGLDLRTGQILYSFSNDNRAQSNTWDNNRTTTTSNTDHGEHKPTLVVKRTTQTVRARSARNGYEKWNFSVSNHELVHYRAHPAAVVLNQVDGHRNSEQGFSGYFQYQLQTGVVLAYDKTGRSIWSSVINAPIAAVWELKDGQLTEKSLFETTNNYVPSDDLIEDDDDDDFVNPPKSHRLAFIGEFNSTPYVIISPHAQKELIQDARKNIGSIGGRRPVLSSWYKAYQKRTLSIGSEVSENNQQRAIASGVSEHNYPLALRPDSTGSHQANSPSSVVETCDTAGYLQLIPRPNDDCLREAGKKDFNKKWNISSKVISSNQTLAVSTVVLGALAIFAFYYKHKQNLKLLKELTTTESTSSISITPPSTPIYHQLESVIPTPPFQSRYAVEYEHVRFLGRGGFGVVFEAINKLDERRVAIKRVSLKNRASGKERALKEIRYLAVLNHPNLIQYYYAWNESPPIGWQEEEDKTLLIRTNMHNRDSISTFPTSAASGTDSESVNQVKPINHSCLSAFHAVKSPPTFEFTFDRSSNPLRIDEEFSSSSAANNDKSKELSSSTSSSSSSSDGNHNQLDANNNTKSRKRSRLSTTKSSLSSSSPFFDHSIDSSDLSDEEQLPANNRTESDDGIIFLSDEKHSSSPSPLPRQSSRSISESKRPLSNEKDMPPIYFYFVMELCQPESLRDRLTQRSIDRHQAWSIFDQIIKGIEYIHSQKLIHRDLKPNNILFSMENTVKIGDFGLVSAFGEDKSAKKQKRGDKKIDRMYQTETISSTTDGGGNNELGGTILYMSPEQMHQKPYNQKVDIYAIGIILFELLYPFSTQMERMQAITNLRLSKPVFPADFEHDGSNQSRRIHSMIRWLLSESASDRPRASELRQSVLYQRVLHAEAPDLFTIDNRQKSQTIVSDKDETPMCHSPRGRISSSPFRRTLSSSALDSRKESESGDIECAS